MSNQNFRGSIWRKWDLQIHVPEAKHADQYQANGTDVWNEFLDHLKKSDISVMGITDYFSIKSYETFLEKIEKVQELKDKTFFPCVEFRLDVSVNSDTEQLQCHLIFDSKCDLDKIKGFLSHLPLKNKKPDKSVAYCTDADITLCGGYDKVSVSKEELEKALEASFGDDRPFLIVGLANGMGSNRATPNSNIKKELSDLFDDFCDFFFGQPKNQDYYLNDARYENKQVKAKPKPVVATSDCHTFDDCENKLGKKYAVKDSKKKSAELYGFSWIKADPTFEGLKQIIWEPQERVKIQERDPGDSKSKRIIIDRAVYKSASDHEQSVYFNPDLSSIIGSRGSGKSTLMKNMAQKIDLSQFAEKDKKEPYPLNDFKVVWMDGQEDSGGNESPKSIFYIPQNYLSSLAYDDGEKISERDQFLTTLLKKNTKFANAIQSFENFISNSKVKIEGLIQELLTADTAQKEIKALLKKQGSKTEIEEEIKKKSEKIKKYQDVAGLVITEDEISSYSQANKNVSENEEKVAVLNQDKEILEKLKEKGANIFISSQEFNLLSSQRQELIKSELTKKGKESLDDLIKDEVVKIEKQVKELNGIIKRNTKIVKALGKKIKKSEALAGLTTEMSDLEKTAQKIDELSSKLKTLEGDYAKAVEGLVGAYADIGIQQDVIYKTIKFDEDFSFLKIEIVAKYNIQQLKNFVERNINTRDSDSQSKLELDIKQLFGESPEQPTNETVKKLIEQLVDGRIKIKVEASDISSVISQLLKNRYEIDYLNSVKTKDGEVCFKDMTGGQKAIALLELIFRFDDERYPILIDQPEDDLDVSGVATDLVKFIKSEKQYRQIIIVTHNASLLVCSDSEQVIMSSNEKASSGGFNFSYETGGIENPGRRENIIKVLEGGKDALKMRARKLDFKHEI